MHPDLKRTFFLMANRGDSTGFKNKSDLYIVYYVSLWQNDPTSHLIYNFIRQPSNEFLVSVTSFRSSPT